MDEFALEILKILPNPVILTETDGRVCFKNEAAKRVFPLPAKGKNVEKYVSVYDSVFFGEGFDKKNFPRFLVLCPRTCPGRAYTDVIYWERRPVVLWIFSDLFHSEISGDLFSDDAWAAGEGISGERLTCFLTSVYSGHSLPSPQELKLSRHMSEVFSKLSARLADAVSYDRGMERYSLLCSVQLFSYMCDQVLSHLGVTLLWQFDTPEAEMEICEIRYYPFVLLISQMVVLMVELTKGAIIHVTLSLKDDRFLLSLAGESPGGAFQGREHITGGGISFLAKGLPGRAADLYFLRRALQLCDYRLAIRTSGTPGDCLQMNLSLPVMLSQSLHAVSRMDRKRIFALIDGWVRQLFSAESDESM